LKKIRNSDLGEAEDESNRSAGLEGLVDVGFHFVEARLAAAFVVNAAFVALQLFQQLVSLKMFMK